MARIIITLLVCLPLLGAQTDDPKARAAAFLETLQPDESVFGTELAFGVYYNGYVNLGTMRMRWQPATDEPGATYHVRSTSHLEMGPMRLDLHGDCYLDTQLALVAVHEESTDNRGQETITETRDVRRGKAGWTYRSTEGEEVTEGTLPDRGPVHDESPSQLMIAQRLDLEQPGTYEFTGAEFELEDDDTDTEPGYRRLTVIVAPAAPYQHRGEEVTAQQIRFEQEGSKEVSVVVRHPERGVLAIHHPGTPPMSLITGTEEEITSDLPQPRISFDGDEPIDLAMTYVGVLAKQVEVSALDRIIDWEALQKSMGENDPVIAAMTPQEVANRLKGFHASSPPRVDPRVLASIRDTMDVTITDDTAIIKMYGAEDRPFHLRKTDGTWRITRLP
jgi:hypothetical protein